jgi:sterol desaturase/sphingolipid hydroxylase (fatty acid hydroxylase superfamily)
MDFNKLADAQPLIIVAALAGMLVLETMKPLMEAGVSRWKHARQNLVLSIVAFVFFGLAGGLKIAVGTWTSANSFGLLHLVALPTALRIVVSILLMDFVDYLFHLVQHGWGPIWRFHRVHHTDPHVDATTSLRFHPVEGFYIGAFQAVAFGLLGIGLDAMIIFDTILLAVLYFQHSNVAWPRRIDHASDSSSQRRPFIVFTTLRIMRKATLTTETSSHCGIAHLELM